jgi:hypothetical protein
MFNSYMSYKNKNELECDENDEMLCDSVVHYTYPYICFHLQIAL